MFYNTSVKLNTYCRQLGREIQHFRYMRRLTQESVAYKAKLNTTHYGHIEQGLKEPRISTLIKIADALGVRVKDLFPF